MKNYRIVCRETEGVLCEGTVAKCLTYLEGLRKNSPKVAATCEVLGYNAETGKWARVNG